jgi:hypothetical protein
VLAPCAKGPASLRMPPSLKERFMKLISLFLDGPTTTQIVRLCIPRCENRRPCPLTSDDHEIFFSDSPVPFHQDSAFHTGLIWMSQYVENAFCTKIDLNSRIYQVGNGFSPALAQGIRFVLIP